MQAKIQKWGNNQGLRIIKDLLASVRLDVGDEVDVSVKDGVLLIAPAKKNRGKYRIGGPCRPYSGWGFLYTSNCAIRISSSPR